MGLDNPEILSFLHKRADWLAHHQESGRLTNHQALIVLCLELLSRLLKSDRWDKSKQARLEQVSLGNILKVGFPNMKDVTQATIP